MRSTLLHSRINLPNGNGAHPYFLLSAIVYGGSLSMRSRDLSLSGNEDAQETICGLRISSRLASIVIPGPSTVPLGQCKMFLASGKSASARLRNVAGYCP